MAEYIDRDAFIAHIEKDPLYPLIEKYGIKSVIEAFPAADVVFRKHYLDALGTINDAHLHPDRSAEIINAFLERHHSMCMEWGVDNG